MINFSSLPKEIRNWLASETATYIIIDINKRLGLKGEQQKVIASLVSKLVTQDLEPQNFIPELAKSLNMSFASAKVIAQETIEKILKNIERPLRTLGIEISKIQLGAEVGTPYIPQVQAQPPAPLPPPPAPPARGEVRPVETRRPPVSQPPTGEQPYIIYKERPELRETPAPVPPVPKKPEPLKPPEIKVPVKTAPPPPIPPRPAPSNNTSVRMVHYSNFRTPL